MFTVVITEKGGAQRRMDFDKSEVTIGRVQGNDIILPKGNVSKRHSRIVLKDGRFIVVDLKSTNGTYVNGRKITSPLVVKGGDKIYIGDFILAVDDANASDVSAPSAPPPLDPNFDGQSSIGPAASASIAAPAAPNTLAPSPPSLAAPPVPSSGNLGGATPMGGSGAIPAPPTSSSSAYMPLSTAALQNPTSGAATVQSSNAIAAPPPLAPPLPTRDPVSTPRAPHAQASNAQVSNAPSTGAFASPPAGPSPAPQPFGPPPVTGAFGMQGQPVAAGSATSPHGSFDGGVSRSPQPNGLLEQSSAFAAPLPPRAPAAAQPAAPASRLGSLGSGSSAPTPVRSAVVAAPASPSSAGSAAAVAEGPRLPQKAASPRVVAAPQSMSLALAEPDLTLRLVMMRTAQLFDVFNLDPRGALDPQRVANAQGAVQAAIAQLKSEGAIDPNVDADRLGQVAVREAVGLGPLEALLSDESVREIVVEGPNRVVADIGQGLEQMPDVFSSPEMVAVAARRLAAQSGVGLDPLRSVHEIRLIDGSRMLVMMPPVVANGPVIEIRRRSRISATSQDLLDQQVASSDMLDLLRTAVGARRNIIVAGAVNAGVTTVLGVLASFTGERERIVTVESVPDLLIARTHVISLTNAGIAGLLLRDVVNQAARLRSDRLVVDDIAGIEALDVLSLMASRKDGVLAGIHLPLGEDVVSHLQTLALLSAGVSEQGARRLVGNAVQLVVHLERSDDGARRISRIVEVIGSKSGEVESQVLFEWRDGDFEATSAEPHF